MAKQAIEGRRINAFSRDPESFTIIGLDTDDGPEHPLYDERIKLPIDPNLVKNIKALGVHDPVKVRKDGDAVIVVDGRQRIRHARQANEELAAAGLETLEVKCIVEGGSDDHLVDVMVSSNEARRQDELPQKLRRLEQYLSRGRSVEEAARAFCVSPKTIKNWQAMLEAGPDVQEAVKEGRLSPTGAAKLAALPRAKQAEVVQRAGGKRITAAKAAQEARTSTKRASTAPEHVAPPKKTVKRLVSYGSGNENLFPVGNSREYHRGFFRALEWALGMIDGGNITNLNHVLRHAEEQAEAANK